MKHILLASLLSLGMLTNVQAGSIARDLTSAGSIGSPGADFTGGWSFDVNSTIVVDALGFWDQGSDGLSENHEVGLWTIGGALLDSATVTNASTPQSSALGTGRWLFTDITALTLTPGRYMIGATLFLGGDPEYFFEYGTVTIPEITLVDGHFLTGSGLLFPTISVSGFDPFAATFSVAAAVPEPSSLVLLSIGGIALIGYARRRKKQAA